MSFRKRNLAASGAVLGIDVGFSARRPTTGLCLLGWTEAEIELRFDRAGTDRPERIGKLKALVGERRLLAVGIDGSLVPGLATISLYRPAEAMLSCGKFARRGKPAPTSNPLGQSLHREATLIARLVLDTLDIAPADYPYRIHEKAIVEAFPNAYLAVLHPDDNFPTTGEVKRRWTDALFPSLIPRMEEILHDVLPRHHPDLSGIRGHEDIASFICALSAIGAAFGRSVAVGDRKLGHIVLPPVEFWGKAAGDEGFWAEETLNNSLPRIVSAFGNVEIYRDNELWLPAMTARAACRKPT
ncbi:MAG: hypothetical protein N2506_03045 [Dehalococcoidales bacterium]|nr:hypothetical protein [Dehalococcoidales bacterium]